jgi:ribosomal protein S18 acetylase RimI-like enzyme
LADLVCLHSKDEVEGFCRKNPPLHVYALGDLDDFFWPHTTWYALREAGVIRQLALLYTGHPLPTVLAYAEQPIDLMRDLSHHLLRVMPRRFYAHLTESVADVFEGDYRIQAHGTHYKMFLADQSRLAGVDVSQSVALSAADADDLLALYGASYPANWFVPRMLETGFYFGVRRGPELLSVAGVHVYSPRYKVAALGNIATRPDARGQGLAAAATARLCQELLRAGIECVGLNVRADNRQALACYQRLGFERLADYGEYTLQAKYPSNEGSDG